MTAILSWRRGTDLRAVVHQGVRALVEGGLVVLPTGTGYAVAANALAGNAVGKLSQGVSAPRNLALALPSPAHALDWVRPMTALGRRLTRRCWPGPVVLVFRQSEGGLASRLPEAVRQQLCPQQALPLYVPEHDAAQRILQQAPVPVLLQGDRDNEPASLEQLCSAVGPDVALAIDAGTMPTGAPVSVVEVDGNRWQMLAEGAVSAEEIARQAPCLIVFVCTGNTCRSPIAEALCKKELAQRLGCPIEELPHRGYLVLSAGMAAAPGDMATPEAVEAARELGADLTGHLSRPLDPALVAQADYLLTMTRGHLALLAARHPEAGCRPRLLSPEGDDVPDPIGGEQAVYQDCARTIQKHVDALLREVLP